LLTQFFDECLSDFCENEKIEDSVNKFNPYVREIRKILILPQFYGLRIALSRLISELRKAGRLSEAVRFQKEEIFFMMLEGTQNDMVGEEEPYRDYGVPLEKRIASGIQRVHSLMAERDESNDK
jgi:hypothetical protein